MDTYIYIYLCLFVLNLCPALQTVWLLKLTFTLQWVQLLDIIPHFQKMQSWKSLMWKPAQNRLFCIIKWKKTRIYTNTRNTSTWNFKWLINNQIWEAAARLCSLLLFPIDRVYTISHWSMSWTDQSGSVLSLHLNLQEMDPEVSAAAKSLCFLQEGLGNKLVTRSSLYFTSTLLFPWMCLVECILRQQCK